MTQESGIHLIMKEDDSLVSHVSLTQIISRLFISLKTSTKFRRPLTFQNKILGCNTTSYVFISLDLFSAELEGLKKIFNDKLSVFVLNFLTFLLIPFLEPVGLTLFLLNVDLVDMVDSAESTPSSSEGSSEEGNG